MHQDKIYNYNNKILKSVVLSTLLLTTNSFSSSLSEQDMFQKAVDSYNSKNFQDSYMALSSFAKDKKLNSNLSFMLARSAYEMGKFSEAEEIYKELLNKNSSSRVKLELAQTLFQQKKFDEAKVLYEDVLQDNQTPSGVKKNIQTMLALLEKASQKHFFKTTLSAGYAYDSNVNNTTSDDYVYIGAFPFKTEDEKSDYFAEYLLTFNHTYKIKDDLTLDNKFVGYMQDFNKVSKNDLSLAIFGTGLSYYQQNYKLSLGLDYTYVWLDSKRYLGNYTLTPAFEYKISDSLMYKTKLKLMKKDFKQKNDNYRDSTYYELQNSLVLLTEKFGINTFTLALGTDNKDKGEAWNVDYNFGSLRYDNFYNITPSTILMTGLEYYKNSYKVKENFIYNKKREDEKFVFDLGLVQSINKNLSIGANFKYIDNHSNQNVYKYDKFVTKTNIYYSF